MQPGVDTPTDPAIPAGMSADAPCDVCPLKQATALRSTGGVEAEASWLRLQAVELSHKLALTRAMLRRLGHDPDIAYHPHEQDRA